MKKIMILVAMLATLTLYGQEVSQKTKFITLEIPEVDFFRNLYQDDFVGDTLVVDGKTYYFSQSPMKQFHFYMFGKEDHRLVLVSFPPKDYIDTYGMADKGYVLHFTMKGNAAVVDRATHNGNIYRKKNGTPFSLEMISKLLTRNELKEGTIPATWLNGRYRLNDMQVTPGYPYDGKRYFAVFEKGKLIKIYPDTEKEKYDLPLVNISERPEGMPVPEYVPEYVYYKRPNGKFKKEKLKTTKKKWQKKVLKTFKTEPFLDRDCEDALKQMWIKK